MSKNRFKEGQEVLAIQPVNKPQITRGILDVEKIVVVFEKGQMDFVVWFEVSKYGEANRKYNAAYVEWVHL